MGTDIQLTPTAGMPPVSTDTVMSSSSQGGEQYVPTAGSTVARGALENAGADVASAQQAVDPSIAIEGQAAGKDLVAKEATREADERAALIAAKQPFIAEAKKKAQEAEDRYLNHTFHDYFDSPGAPTRTSARLAIALNAFANTHSGIAGNEMLDKINHDVDRDFEKQKIQLHSKEQAAEWKKAGVKNLYDELQNELGALDIKQAKAHEAIAAKAEAMALRAKIPQAEAEQWVIVAQQREKAAQTRLAGEQRYERNANSKFERSTTNQLTAAKGGGGGVEADKNAANFEVLKQHGARIAEKMPGLSNEDINAVNRVMNSEDFLDGKPLITTIAGVLGKDSESGVSSNAKAFLADVRAASEGLGRVQSGAAIGTIENKRFVRSMLPLQSDKAEDRKMRAQNVINDINARGQFMARPARNAPPLSGGTATPGATPSTQPPPFSPSSAPAVGDVVRIKAGEHKGKMAKVVGEGKYQLID